MISPTTTSHMNRMQSRVLQLFALLFLLTLLAGNSQAQTALDGTTPLGMAPGAPAGSYPLSDLDNINLYNGHLNLNLPLVTIGGRGNAKSAVLLALDKKWMVDSFYDAQLGANRYFPNDNWWTNISAINEGGSLQGRWSGLYVQNCVSYNPPRSNYVKTLTRLTFTAPDGTEYELRDQLT